MPLTWTLALVLSHSVISEGAPTAMNWIAPLITPSFITLGPATLTQFTLISPSPAAWARFSTSFSRSITISGRKLTPYCCATLISLTSAVAVAAMAASRDARTTRLTTFMPPPRWQPLLARTLQTGDYAEHKAERIARPSTTLTRSSARLETTRVAVGEAASPEIRASTSAGRGLARLRPAFACSFSAQAASVVVIAHALVLPPLYAGWLTGPGFALAALVLSCAALALLGRRWARAIAGMRTTLQLFGVSRDEKHARIEAHSPGLEGLQRSLESVHRRVARRVQKLKAARDD